MLKNILIGYKWVKVWVFKMIDIENLIITKEMLKIISKIDEFKGKWELIKRIDRKELSTLKKVTTIESVGSSTRIEGSKLSDIEVEKLLSNVKKKSFKTRDEQEVMGYAFALKEIFDNFKFINFKENIIKQIHLWLLKYSKKDEYHRGFYKKNSNRVEAFDSFGKSLGIIFKTSDPFETPIQMKELIDWTNDSLEKKILHPILTIAVFILIFLKIHPFQDGNGRISRLLTSLLLLKSGYNYVFYSSLETIIEDNKENYYLSLRKTQKTLFGKKVDWNPWILFFLRCLDKQKRVLENKLKEKMVYYQLPEISFEILKFVKIHTKLKISEIVKLTKFNRNTIKKHLKRLVDMNHLVKHGSGRNSWYSLF